MFRYFTVLIVSFLSGCAMVPDNIQVGEDTQLVSYTRAVTGGDEARGSMARWGGIIVDVENKPQSTYIEVVHFPLNHYGKPNTGAETVGRFKARIDGFVDPIMFEEGRTVTFIGTVDQPTAGMVGEQPYMYPTLKADDYHMWRKETVYDVSTVYFDYRTGWYSPFYYPFHRPYWGVWHSRVRVIERSHARPSVPLRQQSQAVRERPQPSREQRKTIEP